MRGQIDKRGMTVEIREIEFQFKGKRDYIHGTDMFNVMSASYPNFGMSNIRFTVHDFIRTPSCRLYMADSKEALNKVEDIRARCQFDIEGATKWLGLTQSGVDTTTGGRYTYEEERLTSLCKIEAESVALTQLSPFTFIESVVAMNKFMHEDMFPEAIGKWIFTRIDLIKFCDERENLSLQFKHNMNFRLTKTDVLVDGVKVGDIYFSLVNS